MAILVWKTCPAGNPVGRGIAAIWTTASTLRTSCNAVPRSARSAVTCSQFAVPLGSAMVSRPSTVWPTSTSAEATRRPSNPLDPVTMTFISSPVSPRDHELVIDQGIQNEPPKAIRIGIHRNTGVGMEPGPEIRIHHRAADRQRTCGLDGDIVILSLDDIRFDHRGDAKRVMNRGGILIGESLIGAVTLDPLFGKDRSRLCCRLCRSSQSLALLQADDGLVRGIQQHQSQIAKACP